MPSTALNWYDFVIDCHSKLFDRFDPHRLLGSPQPGDRYSPGGKPEHWRNQRSAGDGKKVGVSGFSLRYLKRIPVGQTWFAFSNTSFIEPRPWWSGRSGHLHF